MTVTSGAPDLLVPAVDRFREARVDHRAHLVVVDPEPEGRGRDDNVVPTHSTRSGPQAGEHVPAVGPRGLARDGRDPSEAACPEC